MTFAPATLRQVKIAHMQALLRRYEGHQESTAKVLGIELSTLWRWRKDSPEPSCIPGGVYIGEYQYLTVCIGYPCSLAALESAHIDSLLRVFPINRVAKVLDIERSTLLAKRKKYKLKTPRQWKRK